MKFLVHDAQGNILRAGYCPEDLLSLQAGEGETAIEDKWSQTSDVTHRILNGDRVEFTPEPSPLPVGVQRALAYPSAGDQLDALWHAMDEGLLPKVPAFYDPIKAVKSKFPK